jgi:hypothetical protein
LSTYQSWIPLDLSFNFSITSVVLNSDIPHVRDHQYFTPPDTSNALVRNHEARYRWQRGLVTPVGPEVSFRWNNFQQSFFDAVTVFTQMPDTSHLLAVTFDATTTNVCDYTRWRPLSFDHVPSGNAGTTYSSVSVTGSQQHLAAPGAVQWVPQLLPQIYDYQPGIDPEGRNIPPSTTSAGLIGSLPLLLAMAAFSGPLRQLDVILTGSLRPGIWVPHEYPRGGKVCALLYVA